MALTNPSPRTQFQESSVNISNHRKLLENSDFIRALRFAREEYVYILNASAPKDLNLPGFASAAAMCFERLQGMMEFCDVLLKLGEQPKRPDVPAVPANLDHTK